MADPQSITRLFVISDMHREMRRGRPEGPWPSVDVVILAGDIDNGAAGVTWAGTLALDLQVPVLYVPGNHEYYGHEFDSLRASLREAAAAWPGLHLLDDDELVVGGVRFLGTTLWTDYRAWPGDVWLNQEVARKEISDHRIIRRGGRLFTPDDALVLHKAARRFVEMRLARPFAGPTVVVTHHGPSLLCRHPLYPSGPLGAAFYSDLSALMLRYAPALWVFGHTHVPLDASVGTTRLYSNPRGYPGEAVPVPDHFDRSGIVEVLADTRTIS